MKSGHGSCSTKRTLCGSTITTSFTFSCSCTPLARLKLNTTSSAVNGSPLWNFTPLRKREFVDALDPRSPSRIRRGSAPCCFPASASPAHHARRTAARTARRNPEEPRPGPAMPAPRSRKAQTAFRLPAWSAPPSKPGRGDRDEARQDHAPDKLPPCVHLGRYLPMQPWFVAIGPGCHAVASRC